MARSDGLDRTHPAAPDRRGGHLRRGDRGRRRRLGRCRSASHDQVGADDDGHAPADRQAVPHRLPGGVHTGADGRAREGRREDRRQASIAGRVRLDESSYLAASKSAVVPCFGAQKRTNLEGFLFPATYPFYKQTTSRQLVLEQIKTFCGTWRTVDRTYASSKNLTPYDVLEIASMVEKEAAVPGDRQQDRRSDLQPAARPDAAPDRRDAPLRPAHPADEVDHPVGPGELEPVQHATARGSASDADREPRTRFDPGGCPPVPGRLPVLRARARTRSTTSSSRAAPRTTNYLVAHHYGPHS